MLADFGEKLLLWYTIKKRKLPWRETNDPYAIWLSEIILQQTKISQGLSYYNQFINNYPTVFDLAKARENEILKLWQGLGYYSRARNMHETAKVIVTEFDGKFPKEYSQLKKLKGVGDYTAAAISSIAFNGNHAVVDGNVFRVLSRLFGIKTPIDSTKGKKEFQLIAESLLNKNTPGEHNQALMEFGALQCIPQNPDCKSCPYNPDCIAFNSGLTELLPVKRGKTKTRRRYFNYLVISENNHIYMNKRKQNDIWRNLYDFPLIEDKIKSDINELSTQIKKIVADSDLLFHEVTDWEKHVLSHQHIYYRFIYMEIPPQKNSLNDLIKVDKKDIFEFAVPRLIERELLKKFK